MTTISIWDCGCGVELEIDGSGMRVIHSGGCPVEEILGRVRLFRDRQKIAAAVLRKWVRGYDGDPHEHGLRVVVRRDGVEAEASA